MNHEIINSMLASLALLLSIISLIINTKENRRIHKADIRLPVLNKFEKINKLITQEFSSNTLSSGLVKEIEKFRNELISVGLFNISVELVELSLYIENSIQDGMMNNIAKTKIPYKLGYVNRLVVEERQRLIK